MDWYCENIIHGDTVVEKVYESETVIAFHHTRPFWEHHIVVIPKQHIESMASSESNNSSLLSEIMGVLSNLARDFESSYGGCHIGTNVGTYQSAKHMHWYIHSGARVRDRQGNLIADPTSKDS